MKQNINLYQALYPPKSAWPFSKKTTIIASVIVCILGSAAGYATWELNTLKQKYQNELSAKNLKEKALTQIQKSMDDAVKTSQSDAELAALKAEISKKKALKAQIDQQQTVFSKGYLQHLVALARQDLKGIWLNQVLLANSGKSVTISGKTSKPKLVAKYLRKLSKEKAFQGLNFVDMEFEEIRGDKSDKFVSFVVSTNTIVDVGDTEPKNSKQNLTNMLKDLYD